MNLDALLNTAGARPIYRDGDSGPLVGWWHDASLSPEVLIALCEVAMAAKPVAKEKQRNITFNRHSYCYPKLRAALAHLDDVMGTAVIG